MLPESHTIPTPGNLLRQLLHLCLQKPFRIFVPWFNQLPPGIHLLVKEDHRSPTHGESLLTAFINTFKPPSIASPEDCFLFPVWLVIFYMSSPETASFTVWRKIPVCLCPCSLYRFNAEPFTVLITFAAPLKVYYFSRGKDVRTASKIHEAHVITNLYNGIKLFSCFTNNLLIIAVFLTATHLMFSLLFIIILQHFILIRNLRLSFLSSCTSLHIFWLNGIYWSVTL